MFTYKVKISMEEKIKIRLSIAQFYPLLQHHGKIEWFLLEGTFKSHLAQTCCHGQAHLSLEQVD